MSRKLSSSVTQMAVAMFKSPCNAEYHGNTKTKPAGRRRVFVQTETGCVLGMELDRGDNAHVVKRRLQLALNVPTEESSLTFGDLTLHNDLTAIRNDFPLLLTRNLMHRCSSTPCLSPTGNLQHKDQTGPIEILGQSSCFAKINALVNEIGKAINSGVDPIPVHSGLGGAYYFTNTKGESLAIVKPTDEEPFAPNNPKGYVGKALGQPGLKPSVRVGETGYREVAAYLLDYDHFANVPPTALVKVTHSIFNVNDGMNGNKSDNRKKVSKIASLQQFIPHDFDASDHGTSNFPVAAVHRIGILDIRIFNTDRHAGNLLVRKVDEVGRFGQIELIPIDHGLCLPESLEDPYFEWIHWPQASIPFSDDELQYIKDLDPVCDSEMLRTELPMIREACLRVLVLSTIFLQEGVSFGLCLAEIGEMMSRQFSRLEDEPSELEAVCLEARRMMIERDIPSLPTERVEEFEFCIDYGDDKVQKLSRDSPKRCSFNYRSKGRNGMLQLCKLDETFYEDETEVSKESERIKIRPVWDWSRAASKLSLSLKKAYSGSRSQHHHVGKTENASSSINANEQLSSPVHFVKLADMSEEEWIWFLEKFKELLHPAFINRMSAYPWQNQIHRLGSSCQF